MSNIHWKTPNAVPSDDTENTSIELSDGQIRWHAHSWSPPTDVCETEQSYIVRVEIAGMRESDFSIAIQSNRLIVQGVRVDTPERRAFQQMEIRFGEFSTIVLLPRTVSTEKTQASYSDGFLTVTLQKTLT